MLQVNSPVLNASMKVMPSKVAFVATTLAKSWSPSVPPPVISCAPVPSKITVDWSDTNVDVESTYQFPPTLKVVWSPSYPAVPESVASRIPPPGTARPPVLASSNPRVNSEP